MRTAVPLVLRQSARLLRALTGAPDTDRVTTATATTVERSGPGICTALDKYTPQERPRFEAELREALTRASDDLDVSRVDAVLSRWQSRATIVANWMNGATHR